MSEPQFDKWDHSAQFIVDDTVQLIEDLLNAAPADTVDDLKVRASGLLRRHAAFQQAFRKAHGSDVACPTVRAWYLLDLALQHATLLGAP